MNNISRKKFLTSLAAVPAVLILGACSKANLNKREKSEKNLANFQTYLDLRNPNDFKEFYGYKNPELKLKIEIGNNGRDLYIYPINDKRPSSPFYRTGENKVIDEVYIADANFDGTFDILTSEKLISAEQYMPHFMLIENRFSSESEVKALKRMLTNLARKGALAFLNQNGIFNKPISLEKIISFSINSIT